jgi:hypothetical protein
VCELDEDKAMKEGRIGKRRSTHALREKFHVLKGDVSISTLDIPKKPKVKRELKGKGVRIGRNVWEECVIHTLKCDVIGGREGPTLQSKGDLPSTCDHSNLTWTFPLLREVK